MNLLSTIQILEYQTDMRRCRFDTKPSSLLRSYIADSSALPMLELGLMPVVTTMAGATVHLLLITNSQYPLLLAISTRPSLEFFVHFLPRLSRINCSIFGSSSILVHPVRTAHSTIPTKQLVLWDDLSPSRMFWTLKSYLGRKDYSGGRLVQKTCLDRFGLAC